jgi:flagellar basal-body rod protein FlgB
MDQSARLTDYLEAGLRAANLRQTVIANNIANMATPGFRRHAVPFEKVFAEALAKGEPIPTEGLLRRLHRPMDGPVNDNGNDVHLETEVAGLVRNGLLYKTYARLLGRMYEQVERAMVTES